jgi:hypothetical protein
VDAVECAAQVQELLAEGSSCRSELAPCW